MTYLNTIYATQTIMANQSKLNYRNNDIELTPYLKRQIDDTVKSISNTKSLHDQLVKDDPNQFCYVTNELEMILSKIEQYVYNEANGTCVVENCALFRELYADNKEQEPLCVRITYNSTHKGDQHHSHHLFNIVKINGIYYARDRSNFIDCRVELALWFQQRHSTTTTKDIWFSDYSLNGERHSFEFINVPHSAIFKLIESNDKILRRVRDLDL